MIEVLRKHGCGPFRAAIFDFDGTLSLLRRNWQDVMVPQMVEVLQATGTHETESELTEVVEDFVTRLTGKQTIYQMIQLADEVRSRGASPLDPLQYKHNYHQWLWRHVGKRVEAVRCGESAEPHTVLGSAALLEALASAGLTLYLASGTDEHYVRDELAVLELEKHFGDRVYGAQDDYRKFSKAQVIRQILEGSSLDGAALLGFGDGFVEIEELCRVGAVAVGVASHETRREGIDSRKRRRLIEAGADLIIPHYLPLGPLLDQLGLSGSAN